MSVDSDRLSSETGVPVPVAGDPPSDPPPGIVLEKVSFAYDQKTIFKDLDFFVKKGVWTCLIGPSGCGKSTLLKIISGTLSKGLSGRIRFNGFLRKKGATAWMAQKDLLLPWLTVRENVCLGARLRGELTEEKRKKAAALLSDAGLGDYVDALPSTLSGGMRQRAALLRTLMEARPVILMDEPFSALDALTRLKLQDMASHRVQGKTVVMVTHDPLEALRLGHRIHVLQGDPAGLSDAIIPPGDPPRRPGDPAVTALQETLLRLLEAEAGP